MAAFCLGIFSDFAAASQDETGNRRPPFPERLGRVLISHNKDSARHIYVVAMGHRDADTGGDCADGPEIRAEIFKILEWLILHARVRLILPEGYFGNRESSKSGARLSATSSPSAGGLTRIFSNPSFRTPPEQLLLKYYSVGLQQVEDPALYRSAGDCIDALAVPSLNPYEQYLIKLELDYFQKRRSAHMLMRTAEIMDQEGDGDLMDTAQGALTIGLSHIPEIVEYAASREIKIFPPPGRPGLTEDYVRTLAWLDRDMGLSIILPRSLLENQALLSATGIDRIVEAAVLDEGL